MSALRPIQARKLLSAWKLVTKVKNNQEHLGPDNTFHYAKTPSVLIFVVAQVQLCINIVNSLVINTRVNRIWYKVKKVKIHIF